MLLLDARTWHFSMSTLVISRYVLPRRRSSSIRSQYGSSRERAGLGGKLLRMSIHLSSIGGARLLRILPQSFWTESSRTQATAVLPNRSARGASGPPPPALPAVGRPRQSSAG